VKLFDFLVSADQQFRIETSAQTLLYNCEGKGDEDNRLYFDNIATSSIETKEVEPLKKILKDSTLKEDQKKEAREAYAKVNEKVMAYQHDLLEKYPKT